MILSKIAGMLRECEAGRPNFPPAELYGESWLLRVVLDWFASHGGDRYPISPAPGARWFSEANLPSAFLPRYRGDELAESRTHADGVVGHFSVGEPGKAGLRLAPSATQLVVVEAKFYNRLSRGVKNAPEYDQAARSAACLAEILRRAGRDPEALDDLALVILAPSSRIDDGAFWPDLSLESIRRRVRQRVESYEGARDDWYRDWFLPTWRKLEVRCLAWEDAIDAIAFHSPREGQWVDAFYNSCLRHNRPRALAAFPGRRPPAARPLEARRATPVAPDLDSESRPLPSPAERPASAWPRPV